MQWYVSIAVNIYIHIHIYAYIYMHTYTHKYIYTHKYKYKYKCLINSRAPWYIVTVTARARERNHLPSWSEYLCVSVPLTHDSTSTIHLKEGIWSYTNNTIARNLEWSLPFRITSSIYNVVPPVKNERSHYYDPKEQSVKLIPYQVPTGFDKYKSLKITQIRNILKLL